MSTPRTVPLLRAALTLCAAALLPACGVARSLNGGVFAVPTGGDHDLVGGVASGHYAVGSRLYAGVDATVRATGDYAHGALGTHVSFISWREPVGPYARLGFAPLAASLRDRTVWYAMNTSLELGVELPFGPQTHTVHGLLQSRDRGSAWTVGVRGDVEYRPAQGQADVFVSLVFGYHDYDVH
jgi:hypothetical protein